MTYLYFAAEVQEAFFSNNANTILAACVVVLAIVIGILARFLMTVLKSKDDLYEKRLTDAKETRDKLAVNSDKQIDLSEKIYGFLLNSDRRK